MCSRACGRRRVQECCRPSARPSVDRGEYSFSRAAAFFASADIGARILKSVSRRGPCPARRTTNTAFKFNTDGVNCDSIQCQRRAFVPRPPHPSTGGLEAPKSRPIRINYAIKNEFFVKYSYIKKKGLVTEAGSMR